MEKTKYLLVYSMTSSVINVWVVTRPQWLKITEATEFTQKVQRFHWNNQPAADGSVRL